MADQPQAASPGLLHSLTVLTSTLVGIIHTRLELLSTDLEEDREHLVALLIMALCALFCLGLGVLLVAMLLVVVFWDTQRIPVLVSLAGFFLVAGIAAWVMAVNRIKSMPRLFASTLQELFKDRQQLDTKP